MSDTRKKGTTCATPPIAFEPTITGFSRADLRERDGAGPSGIGRLAGLSHAFAWRRIDQFGRPIRSESFGQRNGVDERCRAGQQRTIRWLMVRRCAVSIGTAVCQVDPPVYYLPTCGGDSTIARSRQITTKTPSPAATIIFSTSLCISTEQFSCRRSVARLGRNSAATQGNRPPDIRQDSGAEGESVSHLASAGPSRAFTGGGPSFADWHVRRARAGFTLRP